MKKLFASTLAAAMLGGAVYLSVLAPAAAQEVRLYKNPQCGCCDAYADYLRENGFSVTVIPIEELEEKGVAAGIPADFQGCHLAHIEDYVVSGHVPVSAVKRMLTERPAIKGISLPGMPMGSPGMGGSKEAPFRVLSFDGKQPRVFAVE